MANQTHTYIRNAAAAGIITEVDQADLLNEVTALIGAAQTFDVYTANQPGLADYYNEVVTGPFDFDKDDYLRIVLDAALWRKAASFFNGEPCDPAGTILVKCGLDALLAWRQFFFNMNWINPFDLEFPFEPFNALSHEELLNAFENPPADVFNPHCVHWDVYQQLVEETREMIVQEKPEDLDTIPF